MQLVFRFDPDCQSVSVACDVIIPKVASRPASQPAAFQTKTTPHHRLPSLLHCCFAAKPRLGHRVLISSPQSKESKAKATTAKLAARVTAKTRRSIPKPQPKNGKRACARTRTNLLSSSSLALSLSLTRSSRAEERSSVATVSSPLSPTAHVAPPSDWSHNLLCRDILHLLDLLPSLVDLR